MNPLDYLWYKGNQLSWWKHKLSKYIYIHIPKCAGTSIEDAVYGKQVQYFDTLRHQWIQHATAQSIRTFYAQSWKDTFTFVRNPFDRLESSYRWLCKKNNIPISKASFDAFIYLKPPFDTLLDPRGNKPSRYHHIVPMVDYLYTDGTLDVDFIGRFEKLHEDWKKLQKLHGFSNLPKLNTTNQHTSFYTNKTKEIIKNKYSQDFLALGYSGKPIVKQLPSQQPCSSLGIIFIGTGKYIRYFKKYYESCKKLLLPGTKKHFYLFTDHTHPKHHDITPLSIAHTKWPYATLMRYHHIHTLQKQLTKHSHILYLDADMYINKKTTAHNLFFHNKPLFGVQHPGFTKVRGEFEKNTRSTAYVHHQEDQSIYWQGCFWGGQTPHVLKMIQELQQNVQKDLDNHVIARWHDESHLNRYFVTHKQNVHTFSPAYAYPQNMSFPFEKRIIHMDKDQQKR